MNRKVKSVLLFGMVVLGVYTLIPHEASAQLFRWRDGSQNGCLPVCCTPTYQQTSFFGRAGRDLGSASYRGYQSTYCCVGTSTSDMFAAGMNDSESQYHQESYDAQGNRIDMGNQWNNQPRFDAQGNQIDMSTQTSSQQRFDAQGNRIDSGNQLNTQPRFDAQGNRIDSGNQLNTQPRFDAQGNRIDSGNQLNTRQRLDAQGNRLDADAESNRDSTRTRLDTSPNQSGVQGLNDVGGGTSNSPDQ